MTDREHADALDDALTTLLAWMGQASAKEFVGFLIDSKTPGFEINSPEWWSNRLQSSIHRARETHRAYRYPVAVNPNA